MRIGRIAHQQAKMNASYDALVARLAHRYGVPADQIDRRVRSRRARTAGLLSPTLAARTVSASLALGVLEHKLGAQLAARARHISGLDQHDALEAARAEAGAGRQCTLGYWARPGEPKASIASRYIEAIEGVAAAGLPASVSIKADLLEYDPALLDEVLAVARWRDVRVHFDAQGPETISRTHDLVERAWESGADVSATLPSRFMRSRHDAERFVRMGLPVRVVKGQGGDPDHPKLDPRASYLDLVDRLAGRAAFVGVATHDRRVAEGALQRLAAAGTACGLEQMRSLPRLDFVAERLHVPVRVYVAFGHAGLPYAIGQCVRRPAIVGWILRDLVQRHAPAMPQSSPPKDKP